MTSIGDVLEYFSDPSTACTSFRDMRFCKSNHLAKAETFILSSFLEALRKSSFLFSGTGGRCSGCFADPGLAEEGLADRGLLRAGALDGRGHVQPALQFSLTKLH